MLLVIVHNLNMVRGPIAPEEAEPPLIVNADAMLSLSVAVQCFQAVPWRRCQIPQLGGAGQLPKLSAGNLLDSLKAPARLPMVKPLSLGAPERLNHKTHCILCIV
jgi:hypothetical protein